MGVKFSFISYIRLYIIFFVVLFIHRLAFWLTFASGEMNAPGIWKAWWIGLRFDVRIISLFFLISFIAFLILSPLFNFFRKRHYFYFVQKLWFTIGLGGMLVCTWVDFGYYSYLGERLSSKVFALLSNPAIAFGMVVQSYPVAVLALGFICAAGLIYLLIAKLGFVFKEEMFFYTQPVRPFYRSAIKYVGLFLLIAISIHSKFSQYPLRWSEAYFSKNNFLNQFALNPMQNTYDTYKFNHQGVSEEEIQVALAKVQDEMGLEVDPSNTMLVREQKTQAILPEDTNVVVIMMESLASFKMGHFGNPFDTTPALDQLVNEGLFFDNFHVIQTGTAASIFCFLTGTPDLNEEETASRNPLVVDQHTMVNNLKDHSKYYFIGGSANWGNIRGMIQNNIEDVQLYEEGMFKEAKLNDIWGISDLALFEESHKILQKEKKPFFAFIQTAGYHKPYTIPKRTEGFQPKTLTQEQLDKYGYFSNEEYNALRFSDHALGHYMKLAENSDYFKNTLFVIYADHGLRSYEAETLSPFYRDHKFPVHHIPLLFYSPNFEEDIKGKVDSVLGYQPDILPTVLSILGKAGPNSTFGLDLLSDAARNRRGVYLRGDGAYPVKFFDGTNIIYSGLEDSRDNIRLYQTADFPEQLYHKEKASDIYQNKESDLVSLEPEIQQDIYDKASLGRAYFNLIKYKLRNNQKAKVLESFTQQSLKVQEDLAKHSAEDSDPDQEMSGSEEAKTKKKL